MQQPLTEEELTSAVSDLIVSVGKTQNIPYPKRIRSKVDKPVLNQQIGLVSFYFFKTPFVHTDKVETKVYGYVKLRGNHNDKETSELASASIIKEQDSIHKILLVPVGHWVPLTDSDEFVKERINVSTNNKDKTQRDDLAIRKSDTQRKQMTKEIKEREEEIKDEQKRITKEIKKRIERLQKEDEKKTSLKYYTGRRVTEMSLWEHRQIYIKKLQEIEDKLNLVRNETHILDERFPQYQDQWLDKYNNKRREVGVKEDLKPNEKNIEEYKSWRPPQ